MTEWTVFLVITVLFGFVAAVMAPIIKLNTTITELNGTMERLREKLDDLTTDNKDAHKRMWTKLDSHEAKLDDHEIRIKLVEDHQKQ